MSEFNKLYIELEAILGQMDKYTSKPTKAESKRIRLRLNGIKHLITPTKKELINNDKG